MTAQEILVATLQKNNYDWENTFNSIKNKEKLDEVNVDLTNVITLIDDNYPLSLKNSFKPPFALFLDGNKELLKSENIVSIISKNNAKEIDKILSKCSNDLVVASLEKNYIILQNNSNQYLTITTRNKLSDKRLFTSICNKLLIIDAKKESDLILLATLALENNKDLYVSPTREPSKQNTLIKEGAYLYDSVNDLYNK